MALPAGVPETEFCDAFVAGMVSRMALSYFKYGAVADAFPVKVNAIETLKLCLTKYEASGNGEFLIDAANYAMIEFMRPRHPRAHYTPVDSKESAGRAWHTGHVGQDANTHQREATRTGGYRRDGD